MEVEQLCFRVTDNLAELAVDPQEPTAQANMTDTYRCLLKGAAKTLFAFLEISGALGDFLVQFRIKLLQLLFLDLQLAANGKEMGDKTPDDKIEKKTEEEMQKMALAAKDVWRDGRGNVLYHDVASGNAGCGRHRLLGYDSGTDQAWRGQG